MKHTLIAALAALPALALPSATAQTVFTTPSGYVTLHADAATAQGPTTTFVSHSLARELVFSGSVSQGNTNTVTVNGAGWSVDQFAATAGPHFLILKTGDNSGMFFNIVSNTADTLTLESTPSFDFSSEEATVTPASPASQISIYKHNTLASVFGDDPTTQSGGVASGIDSGQADNILLFDSTTGGFTTYFFLDRPAFPPAGITAAKRWVSTGSDIDASQTIISPTDGLVYVRRVESALDLTIFGEVLDSEIQSSSPAGTSLVNIPFPVSSGLTLGTSGLRPANGETFDPTLHVSGGTDSGGADRLLFWNGSGYDTYFFLDRPAFPPAGITAAQRWVSTASDVDASATPLPDGGFFLVRQPGSPDLIQRFGNLVTGN